MHARSLAWFPLTPADSLDASVSDDGWLRVRVALGAPPADRRSWALEQSAAGRRKWTDALLPEPTAGAQLGERRLFSPTGGVDNESNPHDDNRGVVSERYTGRSYEIDPPVGPAVDLRADPRIVPLRLTVARSRDGLRAALPLPDGARVYGLGERTGGLDKRGRTWTNWNSDEPTHTPSKDPLYQSIPVVYLFSPGRTTTVLFDSPATQYLDVGESDPSDLRVEVYDTQVDLYLRTDASLPEAVAAYTGLTGTMPLPPEWALGFQQCRYSYFPESRVAELADRMRVERVPCDVIYLDIHYMDGYRVFTWDPDRFPDPARMIRDLRERGFRVVTIVDPGVKVDPDYAVYRDGAVRGVFLQRSEGGSYVGRVWPGDAVFPDFSDRAAREFWADRHAALLGHGVAGVWNDMNEPADFSGDAVYRPDFTVPDDLVAANDGDPVGFGRVHNAFANGMNEATRRAFHDQRPEERGFVLTRAGYAGIQQHAAVWTGDNHSWWEHLSLIVPMSLNLGLSGVAFNGADAGGFQHNASPELFARWVEAACLMPLFRAHTALDTLDHEPWSFGPEVLDAVREAIGLRYQLMPYLYTLFEAASRSGAPVMRPLVWDFPDDQRFGDRADSFMLGPHLLVAPVREGGIGERAVALPAGVWHGFWTGEVYHGPSTIVVDAPIGRLPLFIRGGSVIPYEAVRQHTGEPGDRVLRLLVAPIPTEAVIQSVSAPAKAPNGARGALYADAGEGHAYRSGAFWRAELFASDATCLVRTVEGDGPAVARWDRMAVSAVGGGLPVDSPSTVPLDTDAKEWRVG